MGEQLPDGEHRAPGAIRQLPGKIRHVPKAGRQLSRGIRHVSRGIRQLSRGIRQLSRVVRHVSRGLRQLSGVIRQLPQAARHVSRVIRHVSRGLRHAQKGKKGYQTVLFAQVNALYLRIFFFETLNETAGNTFAPVSFSSFFMRNLSKKLQRFQQAESLEPMWAWGIRMGLALVVPLAWGTATGHLAEAVWIGFIAESICWVELKGAFAQRIQLVLGGMIITLFSAFAGALTSGSVLLSTLLMAVVGLLSGLFKNLGDRGSGLAICVYATFIISNAFPVADSTAFGHRIFLTAGGGLWYLVLAAAFSITLRQNEPYRRSVGLIWRSIGELLETISQGWNGRSPRSSLQSIFRKEIAVRKAIDASLAFHQTLAHQVAREDETELQLALIRKSTALASVQMVAISEATESLSLRALPSEVRGAMYGIYRALMQAAFRMSSYAVSLLPEESLLLENRLQRVRELCGVLEKYLLQRGIPEAEQKAFTKVLNLTYRAVKMMARIRERLEGAAGGEKRVYRSYSLLKTIYILHPGNLWRALQLLFNTRTEHFRYALRISIASAVAMALSKVLPAHHTYWIPFTVILIIQPHIGATLAKARDRVIGTVAGGIVGGLFLLLPRTFVLEAAVIFATSVLMIVYVRKNYAVAAFFITVSLVMLLDVERVADVSIILIRGGSTLVGAAIAVLSSFILLPIWDKKKLPEHLADALFRNYEYLCYTYSATPKTEIWTRYKRDAETANSNAFESLQRYLEEPDGRQKSFVQPYGMLTHIVRITRDLNQIHLEREAAATTSAATSVAVSGRLPEEVLQRLRRLAERHWEMSGRVFPGGEIPAVTPHFYAQEVELLQKINTELQAMENNE